MEEPLPLQQPAVEEHWAGADAKCRSVWRWMQGISDSCDSGTAVGTDDDAGRSGCTLRNFCAPVMARSRATALDALLKKLRAPDSDEATRLEAAYSLGAMGETALAPLLQELQREVKSKLAANLARPHTNVAQVMARTALVALGGPAVASLAAIVRGDEHWAIRAAAADCLGDIGRRAGKLPSEGAVAALVATLLPFAARARADNNDTLPRHTSGDGGDIKNSLESPARIRSSDQGQWLPREIWLLARNCVEALGLIGDAAATEPALLALAALAAPAEQEGFVVPSFVRHNAVMAIGKIVSSARAV